jgi:hypothetical protein
MKMNCRMPPSTHTSPAAVCRLLHHHKPLPRNPGCLHALTPTEQQQGSASNGLICPSLTIFNTLAGWAESRAGMRAGVGSTYCLAHATIECCQNVPAQATAQSDALRPNIMPADCRLKSSSMRPPQDNALPPRPAHARCSTATRLLGARLGRQFHGSHAATLGGSDATAELQTLTSNRSFCNSCQQHRRPLSPLAQGGGGAQHLQMYLPWNQMAEADCRSQHNKRLVLCLHTTPARLLQPDYVEKK